MERNQIEVRLWFAKVFSHPSSNIFITQTVEPILAKAFLFCNLLVNSIGLHVVGHGMMEARVEARDVDDFGEIFMACSHETNSRSIVPAMKLIRGS